MNSNVNGVLRPVAGATITVCAAGNANVPCAPPLAGVLFKDQALTQPLANPTTTDLNGNYPTMALAAGNYTITETAVGFTGFSYQLTVTCGLGSCSAASITVTGTANLNGGGSLSGTFSGPTTLTGNLTAKNLDGIVLVDGVSNPCTAAGIASAISQASVTVGGRVIVSPTCNGISIGQNLWSGITNPGRITWGAGTYTFSCQQFVPSNWTVEGIGNQTIFAIAASTGCSYLASPEGIFVNVNYNSSTDTNITFRDFTINGSLNSGQTAGITMRNISKAEIKSIVCTGIRDSCVDLRNGSGNYVHHNWCVNSLTNGGVTPHCFGGGIIAATDSFIENRFEDNFASGGTASADHFDIFGQAASGHCGSNSYVNNISENSPTASFFVDTCNHDTYSGNTSRGAATSGFACTSGAANLDGGCWYNTFTNNTVRSPTVNCFVMNSLANENVVNGNTCILAGADGILIQNSSRNTVNNNHVYSPSQSSALTFCGVTITSTGASNFSNSNLVENNKFFDTNNSGANQNKIHTGVCVTVSGGAGVGNVALNQMRGNYLNGGNANGTNSDGVNDLGGSTNVIAGNYNDVLQGAWPVNVPMRYLETAAPNAPPSGNDTCYGDSTIHALKCSYNAGTFFQVPQVITATSAAFATATTAGTCVQNTTAVAGATTTMAVSISPVSTPGVGAVWSGFVSSSGNVTINECAVAASAGGTIAFNIRVTP